MLGDGKTINVSGKGETVPGLLECKGMGWETIRVLGMGRLLVIGNGKNISARG